MNIDPDFKLDLRRYPTRPFLREQSIWAILVYRLGRRALNRRSGTVQAIQLKFYYLVSRIVETATGITLPLEAKIGPGLRIHHFGNIVIHSQAVLGRNCTLRHGVTIGNRAADGPTPVIGDDVEFGAYAQVLGDVRIGNGAKIGAMAMVLCDVPANATAVGNPARILVKNGQREKP